MTKQQFAQKKIKAALTARLRSEDMTADVVEELEFLICRL